MGEFIFQPININASAPGGSCVLRTFDDVGAFILTNVELSRRVSPHWNAARWDLPQARLGSRRAEVHQAMRDAFGSRGLAGGLNRRCAGGAASPTQPVSRLTVPFHSRASV
jgi:hypothetical protein